MTRVYIRFRPPVGDEVGTDEVRREWNAADGTLSVQRPAARKDEEEEQEEEEEARGEAARGPPRRRRAPRPVQLRGFAGHLGAQDRNSDVFERTVAPLVPAAARGGTVTAFCYGHTGAGKSHTILGYGDEAGVYELAAARLLAELGERGGPSGLRLRVSMVELHNGRLYDLLNGRAECHLRRDGEGRNLVRGATHKDDETGAVEVRPPRGVVCDTAGAVREAVRLGLEHRRVGMSTVHERSSRSHAVIDMELVTDAILDAREGVVRAKGALVVPAKLHDAVQREEILKTIFFDRELGKYVQVAGVSADAARVAAARVPVFAAQKVVDAALERERAAVEAAGAGAGGRLVFVDLAGADYAEEAAARGDAGTPSQRRESAEINKSLLALKECVNALARRQPHVPYRNSPLTRLLRGHLERSAQEDGGGSVMIANSGPSLGHARKSLKTLHYAALVAGAGRATQARAARN